ncbi:unnamed protein product [Calypogeia fissa]
MASKSSPWGAAGWWIILVLSIPFGLYAAVFVIGDFEVYKKMTISWNEGKYDTAGLNILHHIRAWQIHALAAEEAKKKKFQVHQRYMIRAAATGYAIMTLRLFPGLFKAALGVSWEVAMDLSACIAPVLFLSASELYIQRVLLQPKKSKS